jgi:hypothetical protein
MTMIEAVSQSTGVERKVEVTAAPEGVRVTIKEGRKGSVLTYVTAPTDELMTVLTDQPEGADGDYGRYRRCGSRAGDRGSAE